jgi:hypothetical protein
VNSECLTQILAHLTEARKLAGQASIGVDNMALAQQITAARAIALMLKNELGPKK